MISFMSECKLICGVDAAMTDGKAREWGREEGKERRLMCAVNICMSLMTRSEATHGTVLT